jgi:hypothetical protein
LGLVGELDEGKVEALAAEGDDVAFEAATVLESDGDGAIVADDVPLPWPSLTSMLTTDGLALS